MSNRVPGAISNIIPAAGLITGGVSTRKPVILGFGDIKVLVENEKIIRGSIVGGKDVLSSTIYDSSSVVKVGNSPGASNWNQTSHWVVDIANNALSWESGMDIPGSSTISVYGTIQSGDTSAPYNTFTTTDTGSWSVANSYYVGGSVVVTNPDSSNYGLSQTIIGYTASTRTFVTGSWTYSINANDTVLITLEPDEPLAGDDYYVTYYKKLNNFTLTEYSAEADIKSAHGDITLSNSTDTTTAPNRLTIGALGALRNGAQSVIVGQLDYTNWGDKYSPTEGEFNVSLNILLESLREQLDYKYYVVPMTTRTSAINYVWNHCKILSAPENKGERTCISGVPTNTPVATIKASAIGYGSTRMIFVAPGKIRFDDIPTVPLDGDIAAAAYAGKRCFPTRVSQTITGETLAGITVDTLYTPSQQRELLGAGVAIILSKAGINTILHDKSTNTSTADSEENAIVELADYLKRQTRDTLWNIFKGAPIDKTLPGAMAATLASIFEREINNTNIVEYKDISVQQDAAEPRLVKVNAKIKPVYPLTWIDISMSFYV